MKTLIVIPARYGSTRFPGKPLALIAGETMLSRVVHIARAAIKTKSDVELMVATDDMRIADHCTALNVNSVITPTDCPTGTDRARVAMHQAHATPDFIINLQGDVPLMPPAFITALLDEMKRDPNAAMLTPVTQLSWDNLDTLKLHKQTTPFSGTTVILDKNNNALWFSKHIIPAMRHEETLRKASKQSPIFRHIGLYAYSRELLENYATWPEGHYEQLEGLEQLRVLEQGHRIRCVQVNTSARASLSGIDSPEDIKRAEALLATTPRETA